MKFAGRKDIIKEVQINLGLTPDGIDGPKTWKLIWELVKTDEPPELKKKEDNDYQETYKSTPNQSGNISPKFIVLHHSSGSHDGTRTGILNSNSKVSYHYLIDDDGTRTQFVDDNKKAWHCGKSYWKGHYSLNSHSIGISFYGDTYTRRPSNIEIDSCAKKCLKLIKKFNLKEDAIITHKMIAPKRKNDPSEETHERVLERIAEIKSKGIFPK